MGNSRRTEHYTDSRTKRQQILDAAFEIFSHKGYHRATVDEIIALADTGKGTVYNYFVNKEQLFYTLIKERSTPFETALQQIVDSPIPPLVKIETMIKEYIAFYTVNADLWRVMMHEVRGLGREGYSNFSEEQRDKYREWFKSTVGMLEIVLNDCIAAEEIRQCDVNKAAYALFSVIVMTVFQKFVGDDIDESAKMISNVFLYGVANR
ncbi:Fatty acid metabolism regulator protein [bioreactor metagenome]|uniref:Fatty acid metabolism regulator protein n=1 Tax=bioreactor metagenome TaxID=1076179 RepID=A0A645DNA2_9ZZZZ